MTFSTQSIKTAVRVLFLTGFAAAVALAADPVVGTWKLDVLHSKFSSDAAPASEIRIYTENSEGVQVTVKTVDSKGKATTTEYPTTFDGKDHVRPGTSPGTSVILTRDSARHASAVLKHAGVVMADVERSISEDGTTMTITYTGKNETGDPIDKVCVYQRVSDNPSK